MKMLIGFLAFCLVVSVRAESSSSILLDALFTPNEPTIKTYVLSGVTKEGKPCDAVVCTRTWPDVEVFYVRGVSGEIVETSAACGYFWYKGDYVFGGLDPTPSRWVDVDNQPTRFFAASEYPLQHYRSEVEFIGPQNQTVETAVASKQLTISFHDVGPGRSMSCTPDRVRVIK